ncbi:MAG: ATP-binding protein [Bacteroidetes bacterium]|nr:ATP-binding protein [Bacteroidota bacterium]
MITNELKTRIVFELSERRNNFAGSDAKFAVSIGINNAQYSRIKNGETERVISDHNWISLARRLEIPIGNTPQWNTAHTPVYDFITDQLNFCQTNASSRLLCDIADIGKTFAAKAYVKANKNAIYIDCSQVKTKQKLVRFIAKEFGVGHTGWYSDVYADLVFYLRSLPSPLVILDEAGDLDYPAFLELKALWNATERCCAWYMMGADGLREKIRRSIECKRVGYAEIFSRYGSRYQKASPDGSEELRKFKTVHAALIIKANCADEVNVQQLVVKTDYSLRRIQDELRKIN